MNTKRFSLLLSALFCTALLCSCGESAAPVDEMTGEVNEEYSAEYDDSVLFQNKSIPICDVNDQELCKIDAFGISTLAGTKLLYTKLPKSPCEKSDTLEYHLYDIENGGDQKLETVENWIYEENYEAKAVGSHLYISVSSGDYIERDSRLQTIYDIDTEKGTMSPLLEVKGGIPYNTFTIAGDELILAELLETGQSDLVRVNLADTKQKRPVVHEYDESKTFCKGSIRHIDSDASHIYTVRLDWTEDEVYSLYKETYDYDLNLLESVDLDPVFTGGDNTEKQQWVAGFFVRDAYMFYQNFSVTTFFGKLDGKKADALVPADDLFAYAPNADGSEDDDLFLRIFGDEYEDDSLRNRFYLADPKTGKVQTASFRPKEKRYAFRSALRGSNGNLLLTVGYMPEEEGEALPDRVYYINMKDLDFKPL